MNSHRSTFILIATVCCTFCGGISIYAQAEVEPRTAPDASVLDEKQWKQLDASIDRSLAWLATKQQADGSFESIDLGQPAVTSFCLMAFLSQGESPVDGKYKQQLTKAIDFIADQQKPNGLLAIVCLLYTSPSPRD